MATVKRWMWMAGYDTADPMEEQLQTIETKRRWRWWAHLLAFLRAPGRYNWTLTGGTEQTEYED